MLNANEAALEAKLKGKADAAGISFEEYKKLNQKQTRYDEDED